MKKANILILILLVAFTSCSDWLDVKPKAEIKLDVMFESEQGCKDALIGCYIMLSDKALYGSELTCTFLDVLGQQYSLPGGDANPYENASLYIYTAANTENIIEGIWSKMYNVLANINALIEGLEKSKNNIHPSIYALIKAEAYSLRAFIYTDLVRLFTWGDLPNRSDKLEELSIPYVKLYDKNIVAQSQLKDVLKYIHDDLDLAIELFDAYDPLSTSGNRPDGYTLPNDDKFYNTEVKNNVTKYRMNLLASLATRMRLNMWEGNYEQAYEDATTLTDSGFRIFWTEGLDNDPEFRDLTFSSEMLFGVQTYERFDNIIKPYFKISANDDGSVNNASRLTLSKDRVEEIYECSSGIGASDWRYMHLWDKTKNEYAFLKFWEYEDMKNTNNMPLIKWPEVFYTLSECLLRKGGDDNKNKAIDHLNEIRKRRNIDASIKLAHSLSSEEVWGELHKEWQKEYIGDGQMFYYYKRNGYASIPYGPAVTYDDNVYVLPLPQLEVDFGGRVELVSH